MSEIVVFGHPSLTPKSVNVVNIDDYIVSLTKKMIQIMYDAPGVGLAAPQIGINKNIFVFDAGDGPKVAINPKLVDLQGSVVFMEGCLSLPGYYWDIERYEYAKLTCLNQNGEEVTMILPFCLFSTPNNSSGSISLPKPLSPISKFPYLGPTI